MGNIQYSFPELKFEKPVYNQQVPQLNGISKLFETPQLKKPNDLLSSNPFIRRRLLLDMNNMTFGSNIFSNTTTSSVSATPYIGDDEGKSFADSELGRNLGNLFSSGLNSAGNTVFNNILKKTNLLEGIEQNSLSSLAGAGAGLTANYIGQGISSLGGNSMLSKGIGQGISTGLGTVGGNLASSLFSEGNKGLQFSGSGLFGETQAGTINPYALGASMIGTGLSAAFGPSKEYNGKYGSITKGMDNAYDAVQGVVGFIPGYGQGIAAAMALNKGLSNIFGSTDGMTKQDAILGSAFMPAPVKWLNMAGASKTGTFNNLSWLNSEKTTSFMGNAFGNLGKKFDQAREEAGKTYGTFSQGAKRDAQRNIDFANNAWNRVLAMADLDELQRIRSLYMTSINNLRYAQMILGGWNPLAIGKQGMKIFNNATNHNMGMRLLSAAALIDNKQMILSALAGTKLYGAKKFRAMSEEELENRTPEITVTPVTQKTPEELNIEWRRTHPNGGNADPNLSRISNLTSETFNQTTKPPFTGQEYLEAAEAQRQKKVDKFHEAEKVGEAALMADLAVSAAPLLLRGFKWAFNKAGLLVKVPKMAYSAEVKSPYYKIGQDGNLTFDTQNVVSEIKAGKLDFINEMLSPEYAEAAIRNMEEAEKMGLSYTPVFEKAGFKSLREDGIIPKFIQDSKHTWHARTGFMGGTPGKATEIEYNISQPTNIRYSTGHESGHVSRWGMGESKSELTFMKHKANQIFKDNGDVGVYEFGSLTGEGATNMRDLGKDMGITLRTPYPGYEKALEMLQNAEKTSNKGGIVKVLKLTKDAMPYIWRALQGLHFEYAIPTALTATTLYNTNK